MAVPPRWQSPETNLIVGLSASIALLVSIILFSVGGVFSIYVLSGKKIQLCRLTAIDILPPLDLFAAYPSPLHDQ